MGKVTGFKEYDREESPSRPIDERIKDYKDVHMGLDKEKLKIQGARCMECGTPFCSWGCPLGNLMPDFNDMVYKGEWKKAYERISLTSCFPEFTGRICPALCEGSCTLSYNSDAVSIKEIELGIIEEAFKNGWVKPKIPKVRTGKRIAVIGSGPAGLSAAEELNSVGHSVVVFERADKVGGLLRYGIPDFKLEKHVIDRRIDVMEKSGIEFKTSTNVGFDVSAEELLNDFDVVLLTGGSTIPRDLKVEGRENIKGVHFAVDYLKQQNMRNAGMEIKEEEITAKDKVVVVIGGGDTGSDCIGTAIRQGAKKVYQYEIMDKPPAQRDETMPWPLFPRVFKTTTSHEEGCERLFGVSTKKLEGKDGKLELLKGVQVKWEKDENGKMSMKEIEGSEFEKKVDLILIAMGFVHPQHKGIVEDLQLKLDSRGNVFTDENFMTSRENVFAAGDMRRGQSLVVWAMHEGRQSAKEIDKYLMGETSLRG
ncbi:glutamate synthase (NADPH/NADH) small chain [Clostridium acetobutylicum]|uniref:Small subunit of NADPH-dependent glutamate synthase n=1 Tax=Clostridium acetobutylicum (strain ATCC 824 / DSM 792 / JCM 1419 / IAM 19013 / LMG 5710 / NBRC 13948 / NRRL B-527 / VKM B-1787 / 2291 / W) TaxID=272562 RepID=Q97IG7_CLOAB|nr:MULTISPECIES: glutamate synthase subunit beta [Clostridium]AAK79640.1 Small subunit of NADPH-dependent glutamate synthase [Clostridium acetobutylicum ATCC 824]ADZ20724.1 Small subunit of NADPH-dependent glutamate synthase [Clostridium acetobutylicum EA 2018]AEI34382.1 small subunit of NADPH-dependent glutamate synthase [Clostridium acetobutylicum DSM 1731]AWV79924.1 glutamate synthase subunit beta [Clostridium acetobutylicum]MBC2394091.1 glutamate synthase subunit beta [Clostridium acetobut